MKLKISYKIKDMGSAMVADANKVETIICYKGKVIPIKIYKKLEKSILKVEDIINKS